MTSPGDVLVIGIVIGVIVGQIPSFILWQEYKKWKNICSRLLPANPLDRARIIRDLSSF